MSKELENKKIEMATDRAIELLAQNNLSGWTVKIAGKAPTLAETFHLSKTIHFTKAFVLLSDKKQFDCVTLHEVAHAVLGRGVGHNSNFVELCARLARTLSYSRDTINIPLGKYIFTCPRCGHSGSNNNTKNKYCAICFDKDRAMIEFNIKENKREVIIWE